MVDHINKIIFIHIPKCAGSSIEYFFGAKPFDWKRPNYNTLTGWCPKRHIHLQHASVKELLETELISEEIWNTYRSFTIVRNPWARALSDYYWFRDEHKTKGSFENFLGGTGVYEELFNNKQSKKFRGDHILPQHQFIEYNSEITVDKLLKLENLEAEFKGLCTEFDIPYKPLSHEKKMKRRFDHYSHFYKNSEKEMVQQKYSKDCELFDYGFDDFRGGLTYWLKLKRCFK